MTDKVTAAYRQKDQPIEELKGLGPASARMLRSVGIESVAHLRDVGAVFAYEVTRRHHPKVTLNLLWALATGLEDRHWTSLEEVEKNDLRNQLDELLR